MLFVGRFMGLGLVAQGQNPRQTGSWAPGWHGHRLPDEHTVKTKHTTAADDAAIVARRARHASLDSEAVPARVEDVVDEVGREDVDAGAEGDPWPRGAGDGVAALSRQRSRCCARSRLDCAIICDRMR